MFSAVCWVAFVRLDSFLSRALNLALERCQCGKTEILNSSSHLVWIFVKALIQFAFWTQSGVHGKSQLIFLVSFPLLIEKARRR